MSGEVKTYLINDERINVESEVEIAVKNSIQSGIVQKYQQSSLSSSSVMYNINVPSENTLVSKNIQIDAVMWFRVTLDDAMAAAFVAGRQNLIPMQIVPNAFPLNSLISSASMTINNCSVSVSTQDIKERLLRNYSPEYLAKACPDCAYLPDFNFAETDLMFDTANANNQGSAVTTGDACQKNNIVGRGASRIQFYLQKAGAAMVETIDGVYPPNAEENDIFLVKITTREPLLGMPGLEMVEDGSFVGVNNIELNLQLNDGKNCLTIARKDGTSPVFYDAVSGATLFQLGNSSDGVCIQDDTKAVMKYYSLPPSEYAKMNTKNIVNYNEHVSYKTIVQNAFTDATLEVQSNMIQLRQIPDKIYVCVEPTYTSRNATLSSGVTFPITNLNVTLNNRSNLLSEYNELDMYEMTKRNGSKQGWNEFNGLIHSVGGQQRCGMGPVIILDPVRDLQLDTYLSSGSIGAFNLQVKVKIAELRGDPTAKTRGRKTMQVQLNIIADYGGVLITQQGSSVAMSGLLTKVLVLETKEKSTAVGDYDEVDAMSGGAHPGITKVGQVLRKKGKDALVSYAKKQDKTGGMNPGYNVSGGSFYS